MEYFKDLVEELVALGLTENESRVYLALSSDPQGATVLAGKAKIHRVRIYPVLSTLASKGLVIGVDDPAGRSTRAGPRKLYMRPLFEDGIQKLKSSLTAIKLGEYDLKVWLCLDLVREQTPMQVAVQAKISRTKIYAVFARLEKLGLAQGRVLPKEELSDARPHRVYKRLAMSHKDMIRIMGQIEGRIAAEEVLKNKLQRILNSGAEATPKEP